jgi:hypothetical protein
MRPSDEIPALGMALGLWRSIKQLRGTARVSSRAELDAALARAPRYIVVEGTEALRAYAASLAYRGGQEAARLEQTPPEVLGAPAYIVVPTVGRIRDGYRQRSRPPGLTENSSRRPRKRGIPSGVGPVVAASVGLFAALLIEYLSWPTIDPGLIRGPHKFIKVPPRQGVDLVPLPTFAPPPPPLSLGTQIIHVVTQVLAVVAVVALMLLVWQAIGPGRPMRTSWRVDYRIQGRLVIARVRTGVS